MNTFAVVVLIGIIYLVTKVKQLEDSLGRIIELWYAEHGNSTDRKLETEQKERVARNLKERGIGVE